MLLSLVDFMPASSAEYKFKGVKHKADKLSMAGGSSLSGMGNDWACLVYHQLLSC